MHSDKPSDWLTLIVVVVTGLMGLVFFLRSILRKPVEKIRHGCRSKYGPLELRVQAGDGINGFSVFVEDHRQPQFRVCEDVVRSTLDSARAFSMLKAGKYLAGLHDSAHYKADWRCS